MDEMLFCRNAENGEMTLPLAIGRDENGRPLWLDLAAAPNILLAGCTKQGKSVAMNAMIASLCRYHIIETLGYAKMHRSLGGSCKCFLFLM